MFLNIFEKDQDVVEVDYAEEIKDFSQFVIKVLMTGFRGID